MCAQNHRWSLGPVQTCKSGPKVVVLHAQNHRWGLGPIETSNSGANPAVLHAQNDRWCLGPLEICYSDPKYAVLHAKATGEGWNQYVTWFAKIDHFPQKVILIYARSKCNGGAFFERELCIPFISRKNKLRAAAIWRSYVLPCGRYEPKSIDLSSRSA